jgi:hypothetical protein
MVPPLLGFSPAAAVQVIWQPGDLYVCVNGDCRSKILVLQAPRTPLQSPTLPSCVCGQRLEIVPHGVVDPMRTWMG